MSTAVKPPIPMTPDLAAIMALATPLIHQIATEITKFSPEEQQKRIAKVLAAMGGGKVDGFSK